MSTFSIEPEWLTRQLDFAEESASFAALRVVVGGNLATRCSSHRLAALRERVNLPTYPLVLGMIRHWWPLWHETKKEPSPHQALQVNHRLDGYADGYLFPPLSLWSTGRDTVVVAQESWERRPDIEDLSFISPSFRVTLAREEAQAAIVNLVEATIARLGREGTALRDAWNRVQASYADPAERRYCECAGRLGQDPYDPESPDFAETVGCLPESLFADLCDAATVSELPSMADFVKDRLGALEEAPAIEIGSFPQPPSTDLTRRPADEGYEAADHLRASLRLGDEPRQAVTRLLDDGRRSASSWMASESRAIEGILRKESRVVRSLPFGRTNASRRFRDCRALYLGWLMRDEGDFAVSTANTRMQQASRAFAAELMAPASFLKTRAGNHGLSQDDVTELAEELDCHPLMIRHQIENHDDIWYRG